MYVCMYIAHTYECTYIHIYIQALQAYMCTYVNAYTVKPSIENTLK